MVADLVGTAYLPLSHSSDNDISAIFVLVMSLCEAKNSTTSRFSFLIGTISNRHQNGVAACKENEQIFVAKEKISEKERKKVGKELNNDLNSNDLTELDGMATIPVRKRF